MSITRLETNQTSSKQIKIMTHTPTEITVITQKSQIPLKDLNNTTPAQGHHLPSIDNNIIEEENTHVTEMVFSCESIYHMAHKHLTPEFWNTAVLDSGAINAVARKEWYNCYISSLSSDGKQK